MGRAKRLKPKRLGEKLATIRKHFDYSMEEMAERLSNDKFQLIKSDISKFERDLNEPNLIVLLRYARLVRNLSTDILIDDKIDLVL